MLYWNLMFQGLSCVGSCIAYLGCKTADQCPLRPFSSACVPIGLARLRTDCTEMMPDCQFRMEQKRATHLPFTFLAAFHPPNKSRPKIVYYVYQQVLILMQASGFAGPHSQPLEPRVAQFHMKPPISCGVWTSF